MNHLTSSSTRMADGESAGPTSTSTSIRVLVVGEPHVGKSLLLYRLCHQVFADANIEDKLDRASSSSSSNAVGDATIGFTVGAFVRDSFSQTVPAASASAVSSPRGGGEPIASLYNRHDAGRWASPTPRDGFTGGGSQALPVPAGASGSHAQTVELFELGGARNFQLDCLTPIGLLDFDGWCLLYDQDDVETASNLVHWYERLEKVTAAAAKLVRDDPLLSQSTTGVSPVMPPLLLVGTKLTAPLSSRDGARDDGSRGHTSAASPNALPDEAYLDTNWVAATDKRHGSRGRSASSCASSASGLLDRVRLTWSGVLSRLNTLRPSYILSEARQSNKKETAWYNGLAETLAYTLIAMERFVLVLMATFLFGPYQEAVPLRHYSAHQAIRALKDMPQCHGHVHLDLHSRSALEASLEDLLSYFDHLEARQSRTAVTG